MCGIAGVFPLGAPSPTRRSTVDRMLGALRHRGPHGAGILEDPLATLGNTRLRILDPSPRGDLPMSSEDGLTWIAYNGEITNFRELRSTLPERPFRTGTDTEVLLRLYGRDGIGALDRLSGMFAFALYDRPLRRAWIVRDFFGLRPLFYARRPDGVWFASEIKALLELPGLPRELDREAIYDFFSLAYIPGPRTPFSAIRELEPGHLLELDLAGGAIADRRYYRLRYSPRTDRTLEETAQEVRVALRDSLERHLISDAPVGLTLSGGVDTSSLLGLTRELGRNRDLHVFSIAMTEPSFDESAYQDAAVRQHPCRHHRIRVGPRDVLAELERHMAYLDEPTGDGAAIPLFLLSREARRHVAVLLSGEGGDEIFNAYETHRAFRARSWYRGMVPPVARSVFRAMIRRLPTSYRKLSPDFVAKRFVEGAEESVPRSHFYWRHAFSDEEKDRLLPSLRRLPATSRLFVDLFETLDFDDPLDRLAYIDLRYYLADDLMVKNDRMAMAHGIEARYPYMDRPLVELAASIPTAMKLRGLEGRYIQKLAMGDLLPPAISRRKNMGLEMPHSLWFLDAFRATAERYFDPRNVARTELLDPEAVQFFWRQHLARRKDYGRALWCVLAFLVWFDLYVDRNDYKRYLVQ